MMRKRSSEPVCNIKSILVDLSINFDRIKVLTLEILGSSHLKHIRLTDKLSVRKLRLLYLMLFGKKEK